MIGDPRVVVAPCGWERAEDPIPEARRHSVVGAGVAEVVRQMMAPEPLLAPAPRATKVDAPVEVLVAAEAEE